MSVPGYIETREFNNSIGIFRSGFGSDSSTVVEIELQNIGTYQNVYRNNPNTVYTRGPDPKIERFNGTGYRLCKVAGSYDVTGVYNRFDEIGMWYRKNEATDSQPESWHLISVDSTLNHFMVMELNFDPNTLHTSQDVPAPGLYAYVSGKSISYFPQCPGTSTPSWNYYVGQDVASNNITTYIPRSVEYGKLQCFILDGACINYVADEAKYSQAGWIKNLFQTPQDSDITDLLHLLGTTQTVVVYTTIKTGYWPDGYTLDNVGSSQSSSGHLVSWNRLSREFTAETDLQNIDLKLSTHFTNNGNSNISGGKAGNIVAGSGDVTTDTGISAKNYLMPLAGCYVSTQAGKMSRMWIERSYGTNYDTSDQSIQHSDYNWQIDTRVDTGSAYIYWGQIACPPCNPGQILAEKCGFQYGRYFQNYRIPGTDMTINGVLRPDGWLSQYIPPTGDWHDAWVKVDNPRLRNAVYTQTEGSDNVNWVSGRTFWHIFQYEGNNDTWIQTGPFAPTAANGFRGWRGAWYEYNSNQNYRNGVSGYGIRYTGDGVNDGSRGMKVYIEWC